MKHWPRVLDKHAWSRSWLIPALVSLSSGQAVHLGLHAFRESPASRKCPVFFALRDFNDRQLGLVQHLRSQLCKLGYPGVSEESDSEFQAKVQGGHFVFFLDAAG